MNNGLISKSMTIEAVLDLLKQMPEIKPEERTAKVVDVERPIIGDKEGKMIKVRSCGNCKNVVSIFDNYCPECGAKLDWSEK